MNKFFIFAAITSLFFTWEISADQLNNPKEVISLKSKNIATLLSNINKKYQQHSNKTNISKTLGSNTTIDVINNDTAKNFVIGIPEGEELVLTLQVDKLTLGEIFAYKSKAGAKISLLSFFEVLELAIDLELDKGVARGWFIKENYDFDLNYDENGGLAIIKGESFSLNAKHLIIEEDDIYIESQILSQWFDLDVTFDFSNLVIFITPSEPIPIQQRLARQNRIKMSSGIGESVAPWKKSNYEMFSSPLFDFQFSHSTNNKSNDLSTYSVIGGHDFAYLNSEYYIAGNSYDSVNSARITFSKESNKNNLLGPLKINNLAFGDISPVSPSINYNSSISRGFVMSQGLSDTHLNNRTNINGNILPGWDIELYHNGIFIDKQLSLQSGRYEFNNLELLYGNNIFELISYGPQGQVEKSTRKFYVDSNSLAANESSYGFSAVQTGKSVLGVDVGSNNSNNGWLLSGSYNYGLTDWLSINLGYSSLLSDNSLDSEGRIYKDQQSYTIGSSLNLFERILINLQGDFTDTEEHLILFSAKTAIYEQAISYSYNEDKHYNSLANEIVNKNSTHSLTMSGSLRESDPLKISYQNLYTYYTGFTGETSQLFTNSLGFQTGRLSLFNTLNWQNNNNNNNNLNIDDMPFDKFNVDTYLNGEVSLQRMIGSVFTRFAVNYDIKPTAEVTRVSSEFNWQLFENIQTNIRLDYLTFTKRYQTEVGLNFQQDAYNINSTLTFDNQDNWRLGINFRVSFGYQLDQEELVFSSTPVTGKGSLMVRVFEDDNLNGSYDEGETLVEGAKVKALQSYNQGISNANGIAFIKNMHNNQITDIELDKNSLGDGFLLPSSQAVAITPRKGYLAQLDYPVVTSSEVEGNIYLTDEDGDFKALAYVTIHLIDIKGNIVKTTESEYDGYYLFVDLLPGQYFVVIDENYLNKRKLRDIENIPINLTVQGDVINGSDFTLEELEFSEGFIVNAGEFNSLKMLQAYWYLIKNRFRSHLKQKVFYIENTNSGKYQLNLGFYKQEVESISACDKLLVMKINCSTEPYKFGF